MRASVAGGFMLALVGAAGLWIVIAWGLPVPLAFAALAILGLGVGPAASTALIAAQSQAAYGQRGMITSAVFGARMLGGALMVAALGAARAEGAPSARFAALAATALVAAVVLARLSPQKLTERIDAETAGSVEPG
jgi:hypothetical protein